MTPVVVPKRPNLTSRIERSATVHNRCHLRPAHPSRRPARCLPRCTAAVPLADKFDLRCREIAKNVATVRIHDDETSLLRRASCDGQEPEEVAE